LHALHGVCRRTDSYGERGERPLGGRETLRLALLAVTVVPLKAVLILSVTILGWLLVRCGVSAAANVRAGNSKDVYELERRRTEFLSCCPLRGAALLFPFLVNR